MPQHFRLVSFVWVTLVVALHAQDSSAQWKDPSVHSTRFVSVDKNVELEVVDWGGPGRPMILLAGGGQTAHVFDALAPKLAVRWRVYGITRRGYGASGYMPTDNPSDRLGDDVVAVIDALKINKPILVGHSIAGAEMSSVAHRHPDRIAGLVYLDAAYSYAFDNGKGFEAREIGKLRRPSLPPTGSAGVASFSALGKYYERLLGVQFPEAELRQEWESDAQGRVIRERDFPGAGMVASLIATSSKHTDIPVPALVIFANPHSQGPWAERNTDASVRALANTYSTALAALTARQEKAIKDAVPKAHVVEQPNASHFVFLSNEADVLSEIRDFVAGLN